MTYTVSEEDKVNIDFAPKTVVEEVLQNVWFILSSIEFDCPLQRALGLSADYIDRSTETAQALCTADIFNKIEEYEPRAVIKEVTFKADRKTGKIFSTVEVEINNEYDDEEYTE